MKWWDSLALAFSRWIDPDQYEIKRTKQLHRALNIAEQYMLKTRDIATLLQPWLPMIDNDTEKIIRNHFHDLYELEKKFNKLD